uniref:Mitochondrial GTPase 1 n=1 Tax=Caenorhabditis tropicalis TaxID=1561998 RepID=A0A1I7T7C4_9PELO
MAAAVGEPGDVKDQPGHETYFAKPEHFFPHLTDDGKIPTAQFLSACQGIADFVSFLGTTFTLVRKDIQGNVDKVRARFEKDQDGQKYLQDLIDADLAEHGGKFGIATEGLLWLKSFISRTCLEDITIRDQFYPKGCAVTVQANTIHRSESNWEEAEVFNPDRFMNENGEEKTSKDGLKWIPFGVGPRYCVGMRFAEMEFKTTIAKLVDTFELSIPEGEPDLIPDCNGVIMRPKDPVRLNLKLRK